MSVLDEWGMVQGFFGAKLSTPERSQLIDLDPILFTPSDDAVEFYAMVDKPFQMKSGSSYVPGWTEEALHRMDRLGITLSMVLDGPVLLSAVKKDEGLIPVWYAPFAEGSDYSSVVIAGVLRVVDEWMASGYVGLSDEDRIFLALNYPYERDDVSASYHKAIFKKLHA